MYYLQCFLPRKPVSFVIKKYVNHFKAAEATSKNLDMQADMHADRLEEQHADVPTSMPPEPADHRPTMASPIAKRG